MFHKMVLGLCPQYLTDSLSPIVSHINPYHRRRPLQRAVPTYKTKLFRNSFVPSTTSEWNSLPGDVQQTTSLSVFKRALCTFDSKVQAHNYIGERSAHIIHCRLRQQMGNLNNDMFNRHLRSDPKWLCGYSKKTAEHYFLHCPSYDNIRASTIFTLPSNQTDIGTLLYGSLELRYLEHICTLWLIEHIFITAKTHREIWTTLNTDSCKDMQFANRLILPVNYIIIDQAGLLCRY